MRRTVASICGVLLLILLLSGCRSGNELNAMSLVMGIAIDKSDKENEYSVTAQLANAEVHSGGSMKSSGGGKGKGYVNVTMEGLGISDAMLGISRKLSRKLYTGHIQLVVISRAVAEDGIGPILNYFIGSADGRMSTILLIAHDKASGLFECESPTKQSPADNLAGLIKAQVKAGEAAEPSMLSFLSDMAGGLTAPKIPVAEIKKDENGEELTEITGLAVFDGMELRDIMSGEQAHAVFAVHGSTGSGYQQIVSGGKYLTLHVEGATSRVYSTIENGMPKITAVLNREYSVDDSTFDFDFLDENARHKAEQLSKEQLLKQLQDTLEWARQRQLDVFAFGEHLYRYHNRETVELLRDWRAAFPELEVSFELDVTILGTGAILKNLEPVR